MINFDGKEMQEEFDRAFGNFVLVDKHVAERIKELGSIDLTIDNLDAKQLWWLTKFAKHVRGRCRSNAAFNNYMNRNFPNARFEEMPKERNGRKYIGLKITVNGESLEQEED